MAVNRSYGSSLQMVDFTRSLCVAALAISLTMSHVAWAEAPSDGPSASESTSASPESSSEAQPSAEPAPSEKPTPEPPATSQPTSPAPDEPVEDEPVEDEPVETVRLDFHGQEWLPVLEWLASTRKLNLDWQTLPEGTLNLSSTKEYSVEEAEDLINMQLLARGFTLLQRGEVLRVAPLENIDITLVPKVEAEDLATLPRHRFVRVTFPLDWMIAEEAAVEFKPLISPYGKLFPIASSNRLEAMDAVVNLRELYRLLTRSEADEGRRERVAEFRLQYRKAEEVAVKVRMLLGLPPAESGTPARKTELDIEQAKFRSEAVKQLGSNAQKFLEDKPDVHVVVNEKENSILVNARPDKIEIVRQAIEAMDKPVPPGESSWESINRVKVYEVSGFDPTTMASLFSALQERGNLSKETRIHHEPKYNRLVVVASPEDQLTIGSVIASFRTQGRHAEVLPLQRIDPKYATEAVETVLKNPSRPSTAPGQPSDGSFQIEPDVVHNRLLLWATSDEVAEVREFLAQLGETFEPSPTSTKMHVVQLRGAKPAEVAKRLQAVWKEISDSPLVIDGKSDPAAPKSAPPATPTTTPDSPVPQSNPTTDRSAARPTAQFVAQQQPISPLPTSEQSTPQSTTVAPADSDQPASVRVLTDDKGEMTILSRDPAVAEAARRLVEQMVPSAEEVQVISLAHAKAITVKAQLDALLMHTRTAAISTIGAVQPLLIEADSRTNRLMIQHATPHQIELINEIVPVLDQPEQEDKRLVREQRIYRAKRKRASEIALILKEVYRDLLSTSDQVFAGRQGQPYGYNRAQAATAKSPEYQGLLSVGVDEDDNTIVLSAPAYLMDEVMNVVELIDNNASPKTVVVAPIKSPAARATLQETLGRLLAKPQ